MKHIAQVGGGEFIWIAQSEKFLHSLVNVAIGTRWKNELERLLDTVKKDRMASLILRKARGGDRAWLLEGLKKVPVRAGIVDALIRDPQPGDLVVLHGYLESPFLKGIRLK